MLSQILANETFFDSRRRLQLVCRSAWPLSFLGKPSLPNISLMRRRMPRVEYLPRRLGNSGSVVLFGRPSFLLTNNHSLSMRPVALVKRTVLGFPPLPFLTFIFCPLKSAL